MNKKVIKNILSYVIVIAIALLIKQYIFSPIRVNGSSMYPTLVDGDIMFLNEIGYHLNGVKRFDIVVVNTDKDRIIKRVIGLPGEIIEYKDNILYVNGEEVKEEFEHEITHNFKLEEIGHDVIPEGYYPNDTIAKTIDKCHKDCKTCDSGPNDYSTNCLSCNDDNLYLYLGNCYESCRYGYFIDSNGIKKCLCHRTKCKECTIDSLKYDLCISCNEDEGYHEKYNDDINIFNYTNCYKEPEEYYLNSTLGKYLPCYQSCKFCAQLNPNFFYIL